MTIFGFNTDIRSGDTVYHVQTEAHEAECLMQTAVFVRGRCIGKYASSYANEVDQSDSPQHVHELLKQQHRFIVTSIREGKLEIVLNSAAAGHDVPQPTATAAPVAVAEPERSQDGIQASEERSAPESNDSGSGGLDPLTVSDSPKALAIEMIASQMGSTLPELLMRFRIVSGPTAVEGAKLTARLEISGAPSGYSQTVSDCEGEAETRFPLQHALESAGTSVAVLVQAAHNGQSATKRFRLRRS